MENYVTKTKKFAKPLLGFAAYSGTGKTTLLVKLLPLMKLQGLRVALVKHTHHDFEIDKPGKDSFVLRKAGADQVMLASDTRCAVITEYEEQKEPELDGLISKLDLDNLDLIMVEGFRHLPFAKIELHRSATEKELLFPDDDSIIAVASDETLDTGELPLLNINEAEEVAGFINRWLDLYSQAIAE
jgi:molybdopterin-guanine dinucleotide biosynthesis adapter protein